MFRTRSRFDDIDITDHVKREVEGSINDGVLFVVSRHTTCTVIINEAEEGLMKDYLEWAKKLVPPEGHFYHNQIDNNGHAHVLSMLIGNARVVPIRDGRLDLGTWQRIILLEFDGPRTRYIDLIAMGE
ncbi:MAG: secondary thiamine-phosphate synthase enzyme YjbQ [Thermoprotei archaeon]